MKTTMAQTQQIISILIVVAAACLVSSLQAASTGSPSSTAKPPPAVSATVIPTGGSSPAQPTKKPGLNGGQIAGIVIACLLAVACLVVTVLLCLRNSGKTLPNPLMAGRVRNMFKKEEIITNPAYEKDTTVDVTEGKSAIMNPSYVETGAASTSGITVR